jgi:aryl-phospho-beta-D-glucosidase BglC (GH1 family)
MKVGWNLGNTLEAICGETAWGNPVANQTLINSVKAAGFNTVRLPVAWNCHTSNGVINAAWLARVKTVVDYCIANNMYVILNIHWDGGWLENNVTTSAQASVNAQQKNYWTQIANYFKGYNEHVLFASANEPIVSDATGMSVLLSYHQTFINAVRATGGNNSSRTLIIQGPATDIEKTNTLMNTMPTDAIANRLMVEIHYYTPYQFCLMTEDASWGTMFYYWGSGYHSTTDATRNATWGEESDVEHYFGLMKTKFVDKGIPVIMGEFAAMKRSNLSGSNLTLHLASRQYFHKYIVNSATKKGIIPIYWDNGASDMGLFNRSTGAVTDQGVINAIMQGVASTTTYTTFRNRATGLFIDGMSKTTNGSLASQWSNSGSNAQQWILETAGSYVKIKNRATGLYLDGLGKTTNGSAAGQWSGSTSYNQQWTLETVGSYSKLKNRATGLYLDGMGRTTNGSDLGQWASSSNNNQQWTITSSSSSARTATDYSNELADDEQSIDEYTSAVNVVPNPFSDKINVAISEPEKVSSIIMFDLAGRQVEVLEQGAIKTEQTMGTQLHPGLYLLQVNSLHGRQLFKVIKK